MAVATSSLTWSPIDVAWWPQSTRLVVAGQSPVGAGRYSVFRVHEGKPELVLEADKPAAIKCVAISSALGVLATGDFSGELCTWNLEKPVVPQFSVKAHAGTLNCVAERDGELTTAGRDGVINVWDVRTRTGAVISAKSRGDCWTIGYASDDVVIAGFDDGRLETLDLRSLSHRHRQQLPQGVCSIAMTGEGGVFASCLEGTLIYTSISSQLQTPVTLSSVSKDLTLWRVRHQSSTNSLVVARSDAHVDLLTRSGNEFVTKQHVRLGKSPIVAFDVAPQLQELVAAVSFDRCLRLLWLSSS